MIDRTSSGTAPWTVVEANDKYFARVKIIRTICQRLETELQVEPLKEAKVAKSSKAKEALEAKETKAKEANDEQGSEKADPSE
jgi:hypothetical protein